MPNITNCFYCQSLGQNFLKIGLCEFCKAENPLYSVNYQNQKKHFCCGCVWWQFPRNEKEKAEENEWYQNRKRKFDCSNCEDMGYTIIRCGNEIVGAIDCDCSKTKLTIR